ncbi:hypothetical protein LCGC14_0306090 [marine sediment metagenome]|uniref:Uncharacterized protein n=1 Tax=marine sediment metagenome TaxID=412755 RepID=A0A0F9TP05_9ZZZZ
MQAVAVNDSQLKAFILSLSTAEIKIYNVGLNFVAKLTQYAEKRMKLHAPRTNRSTGRLKGGITSIVTPKTQSISGIAFVPEHIKYQFVIERGQKGKGRIEGSPRMTFSASNWKKARGNSVLMAKAKDGKFVFTSVKRGKFKGRFFRDKAYKDLLKYFDRTQYAATKRIVNIIAHG